MTANITDLAEFEDEVFDEKDILDWATSGTGGGLPDVSAQPFAAWLNNTWNEFGDEDREQTNEEVLKSALDHWTGRS